MVSAERGDALAGGDVGFLESVIEAGFGPIITVDEQCTIRYASGGAAELLGGEPDELVGRLLSSVLPPGLSADRAEANRDRLSAERLDGRGPVTFPAVSNDGVEHVLAFDGCRHTHGGEVLYSGTLRTVADDLAETRDIDERSGGDGDGDGGSGGGGDGDGEGDAFRRTDAFRRIVEHAGHGIYITDTDGRIEYVNPAFTETTGYEPDELIGETPAVLNSGEMSDDYYDRLWETIGSGEVWSEEITNRRKSGERYHAHQTIAPVFDDDREIVRYVAIQTDITRRTEAEERLRLYRNVVELLEDPIMLQNLDGAFELTNAAVSEFAGQSRVELHGRDESAFMDETAAARIEAHKRAAIELEEPVTYEVSPTFPHSGRETTFSTKRYPYYDADGALAGTVAICRDVTDLKERTEELKLYERAITGATDLMSATDTEDRYLFVNPPYAEFHDVDAEAIKGERIDEVLPDAISDDIDRHLARAHRGETVSFRTTRTHPNRGERTLNVQYYPLRDDDGGSVTGVVAVLRDVTDQENRTRQLRVVDRVLQHNIRNDLTLIRGHADRIRSEMTGDLAAAADVIHDHADDLLTTSQKSRAVTEILSEPPRQRRIDVSRSVDVVAAGVAETCPEARIAVSAPEEALAFATPDVDEAIEELVRNAIEHSDREEPAVEIDVERRDGRVLVRVRDDGPGIPEMDRSVVETGEATEALYHGSGLGLWLVYWIAQQSGGDVAVESVEPRGSAVTLSLPAYRE
ncbi:PAS domain S-box protein [Halorubrum sp. DTA98]|uniref:PAS domain S-box protein n=1 Tax=Halorubrum sp. DTA98 TaxID=3402163 RepID=UPI003AAA4D77